jgi:hypothetical protein
MKKTYSGKWKPKYPQKYKGDVNNIRYRSLWERNAFRWVEKQSFVKWWNSEETVIGYVCDTDRKVHRYFIDLTIRTMDGKTILVEIKPHKETQPPKRKNLREALTYMKNSSKWRYAKKFCDDRPGYRFEVWTEKTLEQLGIKTMSPMRKKKSVKRTRKKV